MTNLHFTIYTERTAIGTSVTAMGTGVTAIGAGVTKLLPLYGL